MGRIYCLSTVDLDRVFEIDHLPRHDEKIFATAFHEGAGGQGVFVARALAALGAPVTFVGSVGDDLTGSAVIAELSAVPGLAVDIRRVAGVMTGTCSILVDKTGEKAIVLAPIARELVSGLGEGLSVQPGDIVTANFFDPTSVQALFARVRQSGGLAMIDVETTGIALWGWAATFATVAAADVVCANQRTLAAWCEREGVEGTMLQQAERFAGIFAGDRRRICVTLGPQGVLAFERGIATHVPALPIRPVNTTGAGDTFLAGLAFGLNRGDPLVEAARLASRVAADFLVHGAVDRGRLAL